MSASLEVLRERLLPRFAALSKSGNDVAVVLIRHNGELTAKERRAATVPHLSSHDRWYDGGTIEDGTQWLLYVRGDEEQKLQFVELARVAANYIGNWATDYGITEETINQSDAGTKWCFVLLELAAADNERFPRKPVSHFLEHEQIHVLESRLEYTKLNKKERAVERKKVERLKSRGRFEALENASLLSTFAIDVLCGSEVTYELDEGEKEIVDLLCEVGKRSLTTNQILSEFNDRGLVRAESTTKNRLRQLTRAKVLVNRQDTKPPGYGLPNWAV